MKDLIEQIQKHSLKDQAALVKHITASWPAATLILPAGFILDTSYLKAGDRPLWDYDNKLTPLFEEHNPLVTREGIKKYFDLNKISIKKLANPVDNPVPLKELDQNQVDKAFTRARGNWVYPKDLGGQLLMHAFLTPVNASDEGRPFTNWAVKDGTPVRLKITTGFDDHHINDNGTLPSLDLGDIIQTELTPQAKASLLSKLESRHLKDNGHFNYPLIQMELAKTFQIWYLPKHEELMPVKLIRRS